MKTGIEFIAGERQEQIEKHGFTLNWDKAGNTGCQLSKVASIICLHEKIMAATK